MINFLEDIRILREILSYNIFEPNRCSQKRNKNCNFFGNFHDFVRYCQRYISFFSGFSRNFLCKRNATRLWRNERRSNFTDESGQVYFWNSIVTSNSIASPRDWSSCKGNLNEKWYKRIRMLIIEKIDHKYLRKMFPSYHRNPEVYDASIKIISREKMRCLSEIYSSIRQHLIHYTISPILTLWKNNDGLPGFRVAIFAALRNQRRNYKPLNNCRCKSNFTEQSVTHL